MKKMTIDIAYCMRIRGMLTQFAAATAASGTNFGRSPDAFCTNILSISLKLLWSGNLRVHEKTYVAHV